MKALVIVANGWNVGWLGCYGNEWLSTPNLDRLAAESIVFDQHFAVHPGSRDWFRSLASGRYEFSAGASPSLFHALRQSGIRTVRVHDRLDDHGDWDRTVVVPQHEEVSPAKALFAAVAEEIDHLTSFDNWLLWIETVCFIPPWSVSLDAFDEYAGDITPGDDGAAAQPWDEPPIGKIDLSDRDSERLQGTFASVVTEWDAGLARLFKILRKRGLDESAMWIITSGHGLALGEHGWIGSEGARLFEEFSHVPLIVRLPKAESAGQRVSELTASIDLASTLAEAFGVALPWDVHGTSLLPLASGSTGAIHHYLCQNLRIGERLECTLRTPDWACLLSTGLGELPAPLLFRKPEDRWEVSDQRLQHLEWAERMEETLIEFTRQIGRIGPIGPICIPNEENDDEHRSTGERDHREPQGEGDLRGYQGDKEN